MTTATNSMPLITITGLDKSVSRIIQGAMMFSNRTEEDVAEGFAILDAAWESGITTFDCGHIYGGGMCDNVLGRWIRERNLENQAVFLGKGCHHNAWRKRVTPFDIKSDIADTLARTGLEKIDIWMFHRDNPELPVGPLVEAVNEEIAAGHVTVYGGSNWTANRIAEANEYAEKHGLQKMVCTSPNYSLARQLESPWGADCITISGPEHADQRQWYLDNNITVFAWSSLARGFMTGRMTRDNIESQREQLEEHIFRCYVCEDNWVRLDRCEELGKAKGLSIPQIALAYVLNQEFPCCAAVGSRNSAEAQMNLAAASCELSRAELDYLDLKTHSL